MLAPARPTAAVALNKNKNKSMTASELAIQSTSLQMWGAFIIIIGAMVVLAWDRLPDEIGSIAIITALLLFFTFLPVTGANGENLLGPKTILAGFANPILFTILSLLVMGQGLFQTGAIEYPTKIVTRLGRHKPALAFVAALLVAGLTSAFLNNTPVLVIFIPIISAMALSIGLNLGRALMPLSFITILGGMTTLIGSSANLIVAAVAEEGGLAPIEFFDFTRPGLVLAGVGALYVIFVLPRIVHTPARESKNKNRIRGRQFLTDIFLFRP